MGNFEEKDWRYWIYLLVIVASFGLLLCRAVVLVVIKGDYYQAMALNNKVTELPIMALRGQIVDRKGRLIAQSVYQYSKTDAPDLVVKEGGFDGALFEGQNYDYQLKRQYPYAESMGLVTGYVAKISPDEIDREQCGRLPSHDQLVGRSGIETSFNCQLTGQDGKRLIEVNAKGKYVRELGREEPTSGQTVTLALDAYWQDKIYKMLDGRKAVVVMSDPKTGKIITLVSSPSFDPNAFSYQKNDEKIASYLNDTTGQPLLNRAIAGKYHPGSVFKITLATGGLEAKTISLDSTYDDTGIVKVGDYSYTNWQYTKSGGTNGLINIVTALQKSNDIYFYRLGEAMGPELIKTWADAFGYSQKTGIELPGEQEGLVPDPAWKLANRGEKWFLGNTYHLAIGQGDLDVTPVQVNQMTNVIANNGVICPLSIVKDGQKECHSLKISAETLAIVRNGMKAACKPGGTAWPLYNFKTAIACKTGTAEVGDGSNDTHAWLTAYAPVDDPQISITVLVERGGEGSDVAAPIVGDILKEWFNEPDTKVPRYDENHKVVYE